MNILAIGIGLVLIYLIFAIVVSGVQEWWAQFWGQRGQYLRLGMQRLIDDESLFVRVLQHPLVGGLYRDRAARGKPPSYIDPMNFALAFANVVLRRTQGPTTAGAAMPLTFESLREAVLALSAQRSPVANALLPMLDRANGDLITALNTIAAWFSGGMDRVSGWYKAYAQRRLFAIALIVACLANVDSIAIFQAFNRSPELTAQVATQAEAVVHTQRIGGVDLSVLQQRELSPEESQAVLKAALDAPLARLPIGYACLGAASNAPLGEGASASSEAQSSFARCRVEIAERFTTWSLSDWLVHLLGWVLTAFAGTLGAPYWFAALASIVNIRGSGPKPA